MRIWTNGCALASCVALCGACGPRREDVPFLRTEHCTSGCDAGADGNSGGAPSIPDDPLEPWDETGAGPLSGIFAVEATIQATAVIPVEARQIYRLRIVQRGREIRQKTTLCAFKFPSVEGIAELTIPQPLQELLSTKPVEVSGEFLSDASVLGAKYTPAPATVLVGADLKDAENDPLPSRDDPRGAIDEDGDGHPGVTLLAKTLTCENSEELYLALRTRVGLSGIVAGFDSFAGDVNVDLNESVLGFSDPCMEAAAQLKISASPGSTFRAVRVGPAEDLDHNGNVSCPELGLRAVELFGEDWQP